MRVWWLILGCWLASSCLRHVENLPPAVSQTASAPAEPKIQFAAINTRMDGGEHRKKEYLKVLLEAGQDPYLTSYLEYQRLKTSGLLLKVDELYEVPDRCDWIVFLYVVLPCSVEAKYEVQYSAYKGPELIHTKTYTPKERLSFWVFYLPLFWANFNQPNTEEIDRRMLNDFLSELAPIEAHRPPKTAPAGPSSGS